MATYYIDPTAEVNGSGTELSPYNVFPALGSNNTYLLKRGTTISANLTAYGGSGRTLGAYGIGDRPVINGGTGVAFNSSGSALNTLSNIKFVSSGNYAAAHNGGNSFLAIGCEFVGARAGLNILSNAGGVAGVVIDECICRNTAAVNENSGCFIGAQSGNSLTNVEITDSTFSDCVGNGLSLFAGTSNSSSIIDGIEISGCYIERNGRAGLSISTGMTADDAGKVAKNGTITGNTIRDNAGPGTAITLRDGTNLISHNLVTGNNFGGLTGTGGLQMAGCKNTVIERNEVRDNHTATGFDGVGIYLDVVTGTLSQLGSENCTIRYNIATGHDDYSPAVGVYQGNPPSSGICIYHSSDNVVHHNICADNAAGVCVNAWSQNNKVFNNVFVGNDSGVVYAWNMADAGNMVRGNIVIDNDRGFFTPDAGTRATTGAITLSATTGLVTVTSSQSDFATYSTGYGIKVADGYAWIKSKASNTQVTAFVISEFSGTSFEHGAWSLTYGDDAAGWNDYNCMHGNLTDFENGVGQTLTYGANDVESDPLLVNKAAGDYRLTGPSPCVGACIDLGIDADYAGKAIPGPVGYSIGLLEYMSQIDEGFSGWCVTDTTLPALSLASTCPGDLKAVQTWKKVASANEISRY